jgi:hypothetical protein
MGMGGFMRQGGAMRGGDATWQAGENDDEDEDDEDDGEDGMQVSEEPLSEAEQEVIARAQTESMDMATEGVCVCVCVCGWVCVCVCVCVLFDYCAVLTSYVLSAVLWPSCQALRMP